MIWVLVVVVNVKVDVVVFDVGLSFLDVNGDFVDGVIVFEG